MSYSIILFSNLIVLEFKSEPLFKIFIFAMIFLRYRDEPIFFIPKFPDSKIKKIRKSENVE